MGSTSDTRTYTSVVASVLDKVRPALEDNISKNVKLFWFYKKSGNWKGVNSGGDKYRVSLMYQLGGADSYSSFGQIDVTPNDGMTAAFFSWRQIAAAVSISGLEEFQNRGSERVFDLLKERTTQSVLGLQDLFDKSLMQGQASLDGTSTTTARTSASNGSYSIDPLPLVVAYGGTGSVGGIDSSTETWWKCQTADDSSTTFAGFLKALRNMHNLCSKGGGGGAGSPNVHCADQATFELYESALASLHQNQSYVDADIPFQNVQFKGKPVIWDEYVVDAKNADTTPTGSDAGTWYMLNTNFLGITYDSQHNFSVGSFVSPENQDSQTALILWYGLHWVSNRRKQGVLAGITTTTAS